MSDHDHGEPVDAIVSHFHTDGETQYLFPSIEKQLEDFDNARWCVAVRQMRLAVMRENLSRAVAILEAYYNEGAVMATLDSHVGQVFKLRVANALEDEGVHTVRGVSRMDDFMLRSIPNFGPKVIREIRDIVKRVKAGTWLESSIEECDDLTEDEFLEPEK